MKLHRKYVLTSLVCVIALFLDQLTKTLIRAKYYETMEESLWTFIPGVFEFRYAENTGMAFGLLQNLEPTLRTPLFSTITLIAVIIILHLLRQAPKNSVRLPLALGFILSGAFGNLVDRFRWGVVVDFVRVQITATYSYPTFNLADSFITIGILLLVLDTFLSGEPEAEQKKTLAEPSVSPGPAPASSPADDPPPSS